MQKAPDKGKSNFDDDQLQYLVGVFFIALPQSLVLPAPLN